MSQYVPHHECPQCKFQIPYEHPNFPERKMHGARVLHDIHCPNCLMRQQLELVSVTISANPYKFVWLTFPSPVYHSHKAEA
jgi:hypothetical protein